MTKSHLIANLLIDATENVLMKNIETWMKANHPLKKLTYRVGSGKRTYHKKINNNNNIIVYGKKMIESKLKSQKSCEKWLTGKEILSRNYFNGKITIQTSLCATIIHEFAHFIQNIKGYRSYGSVHNEHFYKILDNMHKDGVAQKVYDYVIKNQMFKELKFNQNEDVISSNTHTSAFSKDDFKVNDVFYFKSSNGKDILDIVVKANPKRLLGINYSVPYSIITKVESDLSKVNSDLLPKPPQFNSANIKKGDVISFKSKKGEILHDTVIKANSEKAKCFTYMVPYGLILKKIS